MNQAKPNPLLRLFPSSLDLVLLMPIVFLFSRMGGMKGMLGDGDTGWHIRAGEWMLANGRVPETDMFSYTMPDKPWYAWEWLWDVGAAWLHQTWGMEAVVLASLAVISITFALLFRLARRVGGNDLIALAITLLAMATSSMHWLARPHLFTLLFAVIFLSILQSAQEGREGRIWWLPAITILWTNLHGGFFVGVILVGGFAAGHLVRYLVTAEAAMRTASLRQALRLGGCAAACAAASIVNPYGFKLHRHIWEYFSEPYHFNNISEFQTLSFHAPTAQFFEVMIVLGVVAIAWEMSRQRFGYALLMAVWLHGSLIAGRNIAIYVIVAAVPVCRMLAEVLAVLENAPVAGWLRKVSAGFLSLNREFAATDRVPRVHLASMAAFAILFLLSSSPQANGNLLADYDAEHYPAKALAVLEGPEFARGVFTNDEWGDYLIYKLYPRVKVFVDGRSDFYGGAFSRKYLEITDAQHMWQQHLDKFGVHTVLMPVGAPLASVLKESRRWRVAHDDRVAIVFRRRESGVAAPADSQSTVSLLSPAGARDGTIQF
jgi:hypothetical protein